MYSETVLTHETYRKAFTIIELVVVIGVIMLLIGIFLPTLGGANTSAKQVKQMSNIRQVGTCIDLYLNDWEDTYPIADLRPDWHPSNVSRKVANELGIGLFWGVPIYKTEIVSKTQFDTIFWDSHAFHSVTMYTDPAVMDPLSIPAWKNHHNSAVRQYQASYPSAKGLIGVSFVPSSNNDDRLVPGHQRWNTGVDSGPIAPLLFADGSVDRLRFSELLAPKHPPADYWGQPVIYTWDGIGGRDR